MFLRIVNLSIAVLLAAFLAACYWFGWRPLPEQDGTVAAPISGPAVISRDAIGVPHIQAATSDDAVFLEGYVMAQDRLWQMDALRRRAAGELAEVIGATAVPLDEDSRRLGIPRIVREQESRLNQDERAVFGAFARGVNYFIETHRDRLPMEFSLLGYSPRPWRARDSMLAGMEMYRTLTNTWRAEVTKQQMLEHGERAKVEFLFPIRNGSEPQPGSNAWAISGKHTASGKPILANDPHLELAIPSPWYLVHLEAPDLSVTGASIAGLPGVITGHNRNIAWGVTNLEFDVQDLYREKINLQTGRYEFRGEELQAQVQVELIAVKGAQPRRYNIWTTRHGPIFLTEEADQYSLHWVAAEPEAFSFPFLEIDRARNWNDFQSALRRYGGPGQNFVYADKEGHIGYQAAGRLPIRKNCAGDVPAEGANGDCEWEGLVPFDQMPSVYDPPSGIFASGNQSMFHETSAFKVNGNFAPPYRSRQIEARLSSHEQWNAQEMLGVERDVYSALLDLLAREVVAAFDRQKPQQPETARAVDVLRKWNGQMEARQPAPMVATLTLTQLRKLAAERAAPGFGATYEGAVPVRSIERLLTEKPKSWFPDYDQLLLRSLTGALDAGRKAQGSDVARWRWGRLQLLTIAHPVGSRLPLIGAYFNIGPFEMRGSPTTVAQSTNRIAPSLRIITDLGDLDHSFANLVTGESGQRLSPHYKDQWEAYYTGRSFPMQFGKVDAKHVLRIEPLQK